MLSSPPDVRCTLAGSSASRFVNFGAVYFVQGLPMGFAVFAVPAWLAEARMPTTDIGMLGATTMLPWAFKVVWAPLVDRFKYRAMGRFRAWIMAAQLGLVASTIALLSVPAPLAHVRALAAALFAQALFASMSDVAGDGLAVEVLPNGERGLANAVMTGGQAAGNVIGGAGLSAVLAAAGFRAAAGLSLVRRRAHRRFCCARGRASGSCHGRGGRRRSPPPIGRRSRSRAAPNSWLARSSLARARGPWWSGSRCIFCPAASEF
jgi:MFS family permease